MEQRSRIVVGTGAEEQDSVRYWSRAAGLWSVLEERSRGLVGSGTEEQRFGSSWSRGTGIW